MKKTGEKGRLAGTKKIMMLLLIAALLLPVLCACGESVDKNSPKSAAKSHVAGPGEITGIVPDSHLIRKTYCKDCGMLMNTENLKSGVENGHFVFSPRELCELLNQYDNGQIQEWMAGNGYNVNLEYELSAYMLDSGEKLTAIALYDTISDGQFSMIMFTHGNEKLLYGQEDRHDIDGIVVLCPADLFLGAPTTFSFAELLAVCHLNDLDSNFDRIIEMLNNGGHYIDLDMVLEYQENDSLMIFGMTCSDICTEDDNGTMHVKLPDPETGESIEIDIPEFKLP